MCVLEQVQSICLVVLKKIEKWKIKTCEDFCFTFFLLLYLFLIISLLLLHCSPVVILDIFLHSFLADGLLAVQRLPLAAAPEKVCIFLPLCLYSCVS